MKTELFEKILRTVSDVTEISPEVITSRKRDCDIIEARTLLIHYCVRNGLSVEYLKGKLNVSRVGIRYPLQTFYDREHSSFSFRQMSEEIKMKLG